MIGFSTTDTTTRAPLQVQVHVLEQAGPKQGAQALVGFVAVVFLAHGKFQIGADGFRLYAIVALDPDVANDRSVLSKRLHRLHRRGCECHSDYSRKDCEGRMNPSNYALAQH